VLEESPQKRPPEHRDAVRAEKERRRAERAKQAERLTTHANPFAALDADVNTADADDEADGVDGGDPLPLVVNTDGAVRVHGLSALPLALSHPRPSPLILPPRCALWARRC
jgi:hypothetical protein